MIVRLTTDHHLNHQNNHIITTINHDYDELIIGNMCVRMGNVDQIPLSGFHSSASNRNGFKISPLPARLVRSTKHEDFAHWEKNFFFFKTQKSHCILPWFSRRKIHSAPQPSRNNFVAGSTSEDSPKAVEWPDWKVLVPALLLVLASLLTSWEA